MPDTHLISAGALAGARGRAGGGTLPDLAPALDRAEFDRILATALAKPTGWHPA